MQYNRFNNRYLDIKSRGEVEEYLQLLLKNGQIKDCENLKVEEGYLHAFYPKCIKQYASRISAHNVHTDPSAGGAPSSYYWPKCPKDCSYYSKSNDFIHSLNSEVKEINKESNIFLSYSHKNKEFADKVDNFFIAKKIRLSRDVRDVSPYSSLPKFMDTIRDHDYVIFLISDAYLKSVNCMYEVIQFIQERNYIDRTFPIMIDNEETIFDQSKHINYIHYWQEKYKEFGENIKKLQCTGTSPLHKQLNKIDKIQSNIGEFLNKIAKLKCLPLDELESTNYKAILDKIGKPLGVFQKEETELESG